MVRVGSRGDRDAGEAVPALVDDSLLAQELRGLREPEGLARSRLHYCEREAPCTGERSRPAGPTRELSRGGKPEEETSGGADRPGGHDCGRSAEEREGRDHGQATQARTGEVERVDAPDVLSRSRDGAGDGKPRGEEGQRQGGVDAADPEQVLALEIEGDGVRYRDREREGREQRERGSEDPGQGRKPLAAEDAREEVHGYTAHGDAEERQRDEQEREMVVRSDGEDAREKQGERKGRPARERDRQREEAGAHDH
ncbi:MAG: hypothetical protein A2V77_20650 [Anaeromyxobacter sp. RBG_16_69_14]|nr:MAG: hypothetical protein A2V77_20650 [Anaeromyxobacter sp. RBG_16_69_14]